MTVCKFYQQGYCKFGNNCRFEHPEGPGSNYRSNSNYQSPSYDTKHKYPNPFGVTAGNRYGALTETRPDKQLNFSNPKTEFLSDVINSVCNAVVAWEKGKQWPLSCFSPIVDRINYPGLEDTSPEELRWEAYQSQQHQNNMNSYIQGVTQLYKGQESVRREIINRSPAALEILKNMYESKRFTHPNQQSVIRQPTNQSNPVNFTFNFENNDRIPQNSSAPVTGSIFGNVATTYQSPFVSQTVNSPAFGTGSFIDPGSSSLPNSNQMTPLMGNNTVTITSTFGNSPMNASVATNPTFGQAVQNEIQPVMTNRTNRPIVQTDNNAKLVQMIYTPLESLSNEERDQFAASNFTLGIVPVKPPPREYC